MGRVPNYKAKQLVVDRVAFRGANIFGRFLPNGGYCVYSYTENWPLYLYWGSTWFGNVGFYSQTTARHSRLLRPTVDIVWLPRALMQALNLYGSQRNMRSDQSLEQMLGQATLAAAYAAGPRVEQPAQVTTHLANAVVDWETPRRRRVMPV